MSARVLARLLQVLRPQLQRVQMLQLAARRQVRQVQKLLVQLLKPLRLTLPK
jgi:hypothetical protein